MTSAVGWALGFLAAGIAVEISRRARLLTDAGAVAAGVLGGGILGWGGLPCGLAGGGSFALPGAFSRPSERDRHDPALRRGMRDARQVVANGAPWSR